MCLLQIFLSAYGLSYQSLDCVYHRAEVFDFNKIQFINYLFFFCPFVFSRTAPTPYGGSQARGLIGAVDASLCHSHSNSESEARLSPTPQLMATLDP